MSTTNNANSPRARVTPAPRRPRAFGTYHLQPKGFVTMIDNGAWVTNAKWWTHLEEAPVEALRNAGHYMRIDIQNASFPPSFWLAKDEHKHFSKCCIAINNTIIVFSKDAEEAEKNEEAVEIELLYSTGMCFRDPPGFMGRMEDMEYSPVSSKTGSTPLEIGLRVSPVGPGGNAFLVIDYWAPEVEQGVPCTPTPIKMDWETDMGLF